jgi:hypothetical protein
MQGCPLHALFTIPVITDAPSRIVFTGRLLRGNQRQTPRHCGTHQPLVVNESTMPEMHCERATQSVTPFHQNGER